MDEEDIDSDYDDDDSDYDEDEEEEEEEESDDENQDSATEIETDSEFDQNSNVDVRLAPQEIPTIIVNELETENLKKSFEQLASAVPNWSRVNGNKSSSAANEAPPANPEPPSAPQDQWGHPKQCYVDQIVSLEPARPAHLLQRTKSDLETKYSSTSGSPRSGVLAYLRRHELLERSPSTDMVACRNSHELKKKYLFRSLHQRGSISDSEVGLGHQFGHQVEKFRRHHL